MALEEDPRNVRVVGAIICKLESELPEVLCYENIPLSSLPAVAPKIPNTARH